MSNVHAFNVLMFFIICAILQPCFLKKELNNFVYLVFLYNIYVIDLRVERHLK